MKISPKLPSEFETKLIPKQLKKLVTNTSPLLKSLDWDWQRLEGSW
jgi:hypothetical protein